jgi:hypothetical protein
MGIGYDEIERHAGLIHAFAFDADHVAVALRTSAPAAIPCSIRSPRTSRAPAGRSAPWTPRAGDESGHPKPKRLILADDWPAGIHPLRKEVPYNLVPPAAEDVAYQLDAAPPGTTIVPVGPFHLSLHVPEHFAVYVAADDQGLRLSLYTLAG